MAGEAAQFDRGLVGATVFPSAAARAASCAMIKARFSSFVGIVFRTLARA
jgi:hypothetical protein